MDSLKSGFWALTPVISGDSSVLVGLMGSGKSSLPRDPLFVASDRMSGPAASAPPAMSGAKTWDTIPGKPKDHLVNRA